MSVVGGERSGAADLFSRESAGSKRSARPGDRPVHRPADAEDQNVLWDVAGVAAYLLLPTSAVYKMTAKSAAVRIPHVRIGGRLRFRRLDIDRWLTLLTDSNLKTLSRVKQKALEVTNGVDSQTPNEKR